jgi:hypothetical protein
MVLYIMQQIKKVLKTYSDLLDHLLIHIKDINESIDPKDFKSAKEIIDAIKTLKKHIKK